MSGQRLFFEDAAVCFVLYKYRIIHGQKQKNEPFLPAAARRQARKTLDFSRFLNCAAQIAKQNLRRFYAKFDQKLPDFPLLAGAYIGIIRSVSNLLKR